MKRPVILGVIAGLLICGFYLFVYYSGRQFTGIGMFSRLIGISLLIPFVAAAIYAKKSEQGGFIGYREGIKAGMRTVAVSAVVLALFNYIFFRLELAGAYMNEAHRYILESNMKREDSYKTISAVYWTYSPGSQALYSLIWTVIAGFIISFITSVFMVKKRKETA